jgi:muramoyltetrapeptide carboxypeptidase
VAVVAPAGPLDADRLRRGVERLGDAGYGVRLGEHLLATDPQRPWLAGTDRQRADDLAAAWCDPDVTAVVAARGGHGTGRLLELLPWEAMAAAGPRLLVGSSDLTSLHLAVHRRLGLATVFGPMLAAEAAVGDDADPATWSALLGALAHPTAAATLAGRPGPRGGTAVGVLAGGTLALLAAAVGTPDQPDLPGAVLLVEDVGETPPRLQRAIGQLRSAGVLDGIVGVAVGSVVDSGRLGAWAVADAAADLGVPVVTDLPLGHGRVQAAALLGGPAHLDADAGVLVLGRAG